MIKILAVIIIMVVVNLVMIFAIVKAAGRVEATIRKYYIARIGDEEKKADDRRNKDVLMFAASSNEEEDKKSENGNYQKDVAEVMREVPVYAAAGGSVQNAVKYKNSDFLDDYRIMRRMDMLSKSAALEQVMGVQEQDAQLGLLYEQMLEILDYDCAYRVSLREPEEQEELLREVFTPEMQKILDGYLAITGKRLNVVDFYSFLQEQSVLFGNTFYVYKPEGTGDVLVDTDRVKTVEDSEMTEGVKIIYQNKLYDYSI